MTDEADRTIFDSSELSSEERAAVRKGEERGKKAAMAEDPERFGMARQKALGRKAYDEGYVRAFGHE
jgi:hypothetical protein